MVLCLTVIVLLWCAKNHQTHPPHTKKTSPMYFLQATRFDPCHSPERLRALRHPGTSSQLAIVLLCLLYTSDAADDLLCVDLGGRRIIKKKK